MTEQTVERVDAAVSGEPLLDVVDSAIREVDRDSGLAPRPVAGEPIGEPIGELLDEEIVDDVVVVETEASAITEPGQKQDSEIAEGQSGHYRSRQSAQALFKNQIGYRCLTTSCHGMFFAAHTVMLYKSDDFSAGPVQPLNRTVDVSLTRQWTAGDNGLPRLVLCFRIYSPFYDAEENRVRFGHTCLFAKDGSYMPHPGASGKIFDPNYIPQNFQTFLAMDAEVQAAAKSVVTKRESAWPGRYNNKRKLLSDGPSFGDVVLGFTDGSLPPSMQEVADDPRVILALQEALLQYTQPGAPAPSWLMSPGGKVTKIVRDHDEQLVIVEFDEDKAVELPVSATQSANLSVGNTLSDDLQLASISFNRPLRGWDDVVNKFGARELRFMLRKIWQGSQFEYDGLVYIPFQFLTPAIAKKHVRVCRDVSRILGRTYHHYINMTELGFAEHEPAISVWNMGGPASSDRLSFGGTGWSAELYTVQPQWAGYFEPLG